MRDAGGFPPVLTHMVRRRGRDGDLLKCLGVYPIVSISKSIRAYAGSYRCGTNNRSKPWFFVGFVVVSVAGTIYQSENLVK